jgi:hypothetical protein
MGLIPSENSRRGRERGLGVQINIRGHALRAARSRAQAFQLKYYATIYVIECTERAQGGEGGAGFCGFVKFPAL